MTEKTLTRNVMRYLKALPACCPIRVVQGPYGGMRGVSDIIGCYRGQFFAIELKVGKNKPTKLQTRFLQLVRDAGGHASVCRSLDDVEQAINRIQNRIKNGIS